MSNERDVGGERFSKPSKRHVAKQQKQHRRRQRQTIIKRVIIISVAGAVAILGVWGFRFLSARSEVKKAEALILEEQRIKEEQQKAVTQRETIEIAKRLALGYDYDGAIALLNDNKESDINDIFPQQIAQYEATKAQLVAADLEQIPHVFFRTLLADPEVAWNQEALDKNSNDYNAATTLEEFKQIIKQMYDNDYVLVRMHDIVEETTDEQGNVVLTSSQIMLPEGKKPFIMSQDDVNYPFDAAGTGYATRMVVGEDGRLTTEYIKSDDLVVTGAYDLVPALNDFIAEHPDFSYKGARAILAFTGVNGILGYRTNPDLAKTEVEGNQLAAEYGVFNTEEEIAKVKPVVAALQAEGWEFASNSYGYLSYGSSLDKVKADADKWQEQVASIIGPTDILVYPFGTDIGGWQPYSLDNEKYEYLKGQGFRFYCNIDSTPYWIQITNENVRQGRINLDGYRMYQDLYNGADKLSQLFDVKSVFDENRPVTGLVEWDGAE